MKTSALVSPYAMCICVLTTKQLGSYAKKPAGYANITDCEVY